MQPKITLFSEKKFEQPNKRGLSIGFLYNEDAETGCKSYCIDSTKIDMEFSNTKILYGSTSNLKAITILPGYTIKFEINELSSISIETENYLLCEHANDNAIHHATPRTKYKEIVYNTTLLDKYLSEISSCIIKTPIKICNINCNIFFSQHNILTADGGQHASSALHIQLLTPQTIGKIRQIIKRVDASLNLLAIENEFSSNVGLMAENDSYYTYNYSSYRTKNNQCFLYLLLDGEMPHKRLLKSLHIVSQFSDENAIAPLLMPNQDIEFTEYIFIRYYTALEEIRKQEKYKTENNAGKHFNELLFEENSDILEKLLGKQNTHNLENEINELRNQYIHSGFAIPDNKLKIKEKKTIKYTKSINRQWVIGVTKLLIYSYHLYLLRKAGVLAAKTIAKRRASLL